MREIATESRIKTAYKKRLDSCIKHLDQTDHPTSYFDRNRALLVYYVAELNGCEVIMELEIKLYNKGSEERLIFTPDRDAKMTVKRGNETEIMEIKGSAILTILASTYESLQRELSDPEWNLRTKSRKLKKYCNDEE